MVELQGGNFGNGFAAAGLSAAAGVSGLEGPAGQLTAQGVIVSAVVGGTASVITGGKFANGAVTASFGYVYNYAKHHSQDNRNLPEVFKSKDFRRKLNDALSTNEAYTRVTIGNHGKTVGLIVRKNADGTFQIEPSSGPSMTIPYGYENKAPCRLCSVFGISPVPIENAAAIAVAVPVYWTDDVITGATAIHIFNQSSRVAHGAPVVVRGFRARHDWIFTGEGQPVPYE